jgi:HEAT repeat protein
VSVSRLLPARRPAVLLGLAALALAAGGLAWWAARPADRLAYDFIPGRRLVYELEYVSVSASDFTPALADSPAAGGGALAHDFQTSVEGELEVTAAGPDRDTHVLAYRLRHPEVRLAADGELALDRAKALRAELARTHFAEVDRRGRVIAARLDPRLGGLPSSLVRTLLAATQVVLPEGDRPDSWEAEEDDPNGTYLAHYEADPGRGVRTLRKTRLRYRPTESSDPVHEFTAPLVVRPSGGLTARFDARAGHLVSVEGTESTTLLVRDRVVARSETTVRLKLVRAETMTEGQEQALRDRRLAAGRTTVGVPLSAGESEQAREGLTHRTELGDSTAEGLLADLARAERGDKEVDETRLVLKLTALAYLHPEQSGALARSLADARSESVTMRVLSQALAESGRPEAQSALAGVLRARDRDLPALLFLIPALGMAKAPTQEAERALARLASDDREEVRSTARLALGVMARSLARRDPARADAIVRWALDGLGKARSADERRQLLLVLGNAGSPRARPALRKHLSAPEPEVRAAAVGALRWLGGAEAESALCRALTADPDDSVRLEAAAAFELRRMTESALSAHAKALADESPTVRLAVLKNLARGRRTSPKAEALLKKAAESDAVEDVRKAAAELLEGDES